MEYGELFYRFGVALAIGALVGIQRQYVDNTHQHPTPAGGRTFMLMALLGCAGAYLADEVNSGWILAATIISVAALIITAYIMSYDGAPGITTEVTGVLIVVCGALCYAGHITLAGALGVTVTALLNLKGPMNDFIDNLNSEDMRAALTFGIISVVILPVLPSEPLGDEPFDVLNPQKIWLMVVFVSGISFLGYTINKMFSARYGLLLTGLVGGMASSTAATMSFSERSCHSPEHPRPFALAMMLSWAMLCPRVLLTVGVVAPSLLQELWLPMTLILVANLLYCLYLYRKQQRIQSDNITFENPFQLKPALQFGVLYAIILVIARAAQLYLDNTGIYLSSAVAGLVDLNAITLTLAELTRNDGIAHALAVDGIILATIANTIFKTGLVWTSGTAALRRLITGGALLLIVVSGLVMLLL